MERSQRITADGHPRISEQANGVRWLPSVALDASVAASELGVVMPSNRKSP
jgi:hypothetical protein